MLEEMPSSSQVSSSHTFRSYTSSSLEAINARRTRAEVPQTQEEHDWRGGARLLHRSATKSCLSLGGQ